MKERILALLINGLKASEIVGIVGCSPSYISQLASDSEFMKRLEAGKLEAAAVKTEEDHIDTRYQNLEHKIISSMESALADASLGEMTRALETINKRQDSKYARKHPTTQQPQIGNVNIVSLMLPSHATKYLGPVIEMNSNNEIIAIEGKPLAPMSADGVKNIFAQITASKAALVEAEKQQVLEQL